MTLYRLLTWLLIWIDLDATSQEELLFTHEGALGPAHLLGFGWGLLCVQVAVISHAAWVAGAIMVVSNSMGVNRPRWSCCLR